MCSYWHHHLIVLTLFWFCFGIFCLCREGDVVSLHLLQLAFGERKCLASGKIIYEVQSCVGFYIFIDLFECCTVFISIYNVVAKNDSFCVWCFDSQGLEYCEERYSQDLNGTAFPLRAQATNTRLISCQTIEKFRHHPDRDDSMNEGAFACPNLYTLQSDWFDTYFL